MLVGLHNQCVLFTMVDMPPGSSIFKNGTGFSSQANTLHLWCLFSGEKPQVTLKLKGHKFFFLVDKEGEFLQPTLFDKTVGVKRF